ncbi:hypothetical protein V6N13_074304 [Hibiscus sabdariffa]
MFRFQLPLNYSNGFPSKAATRSHQSLLPAICIIHLTSSPLKTSIQTNLYQNKTQSSPIPSQVTHHRQPPPPPWSQSPLVSPPPIHQVRPNNIPKARPDLSKMLGLYANANICRVALGRDFSHGEEYDCHGFQKMLEQYQELLGGFSIGDFFPSMEFIHNLTGLKFKLQETFRCFDRLFDEIINEHRNPDQHKDEHKKDLLDVLLDIMENRSKSSDGIHLTIDNVKAIILGRASFLALQGSVGM